MQLESLILYYYFYRAPIISFWGVKFIIIISLYNVSKTVSTHYTKGIYNSKAAVSLYPTTVQIKQTNTTDRKYCAFLARVREYFPCPV